MKCCDSKNVIEEKEMYLCTNCGVIHGYTWVEYDFIYIFVIIFYSIYICNNIIIFINLIQIIWDISNTKTIKYENIIIFSR